MGSFSAIEIKKARPQPFSATLSAHARDSGHPALVLLALDPRFRGDERCEDLLLRLRHDAETEPAMITSSPCFQFTGVATLCFAVICSESITRSTSSKLRPVVIG